MLSKLLFPNHRDQVSIITIIIAVVITVEVITDVETLIIIGVTITSEVTTLVEVVVHILQADMVEEVIVTKMIRVIPRRKTRIVIIIVNLV